MTSRYATCQTHFIVRLRVLDVMTSGSVASGSPNPAGGVRGRPRSHAMVARRDALIPIGESEPISIVRGEPSELSSILVSPSAAPFQRRFVLCLVPLESQAGMDLLPRFDRVAEFPCQIDHIHHCWLA